MALVINGRFLTRPTTGVERYGHMLLQIIAKEWPDSRIILPARCAEDVDTHGLEVVRQNGLGGHAWEQLQLPRALRKDDLLLSPANTGPLRVRNQVVVVHDLAVIHHPEWFDRRFAHWYNFLLPRLTRRVARVVTVSPTSEADLLQTYALHEERVSLVSPFIPAPSSKATEHGLDAPYYLMVASRDPRKGYDRALEWYAHLSEPTVKLVIVGREGPAFNMPRPIDLNGVVPLTNVDDERLSALYSGAIALLQPSRYEGFGLPVLEALHHGCPVIASDLPVFRALFGDALLYADIGANRTMIEPMSKLADPVERERIIATGRLRAASFSLERTTAELHNALDPLLIG